MLPIEAARLEITLGLVNGRSTLCVGARVWPVICYSSCPLEVLFVGQGESPAKRIQGLS